MAIFFFSTRTIDVLSYTEKNHEPKWKIRERFGMPVPQANAVVRSGVRVHTTTVSLAVDDQECWFKFLEIMFYSKKVFDVFPDRMFYGRKRIPYH